MMKTFKHSISERNTFKMRALVQECGIVGFGIYWYILEEIKEGVEIKTDTPFYNAYSLIFKISNEELKKAIETILKLEILVLNNNMLISKEMQETKEKRAEAGRKGMQERWKKPEKVIVENKPVETKKVKKSNDLDFEALENMNVDEFNPIIKPKRRSNINPKEESVLLFKDWEFLALFNEIKKELNPRARGNTVLTKTDKSNFNILIKNGYGKEDFRMVITTALNNQYVQDNGLDVPEHVLRNNNFERYLNKSSKSQVNFQENITDEPEYK